MYKFIFNSILLILIFSNISKAQLPSHQWNNFTTEDGLVDNYVQVMIQDNEGGLWFGTIGGGISWYKDGIWKNYTAGNSPLAGNDVRAIIVDHEGALWFGTDRGINKYELNGIWTTYNSSNSGLAGNNVWSIVEDRYGALWFGTTFHGVSKYENDEWQNFTQQNSGLSDNWIYAIIEDSHGALWFGTARNGVSCYKNGNWTQFNVANGALTNNVVKTIREDSNGAIWVGTQAGLNKYDADIWEKIQEKNLAYLSINSIFEDSQGIIWVGTNTGVYQFIGGKWEGFKLHAEDRDSNWILDIYEDVYGAIWFCSHGKGVTRFEESIWQSFIADSCDLADDCVTTILLDSKGRFWFGTHYRGISLLKDSEWGTFNTQNSDLAENRITCMVEDNTGGIWIGTYQNGVNYFYNDEWELLNSSNSSLADNHINALLIDSQQRLWFATDRNGINIKVNNQWTHYDTINSQLVSNKVYTLFEDSQKTIWLGTGNGLNRLEAENWEAFTTGNSGLPGNQIYAIHEDYEGRVWIGTEAGIVLFNKGIWEPVYSSYGEPPGKKINFIFLDSNDAIWCGTEDGVYRYKDESWSVFTETNSNLVGNDVKDIVEYKKGEFCFATFSGVTFYRGDHVPPTVHIISTPDKISETSTPFFTFQGRDYQTNVEDILYTYAVIESSQVITENDYSSFFKTTYKYLPPLKDGTYTFYIRARDQMANLSKPASYIFTVDTEAPTTTIEYPKFNETISQVIAVRGSVYDNSPIQDFDYYNLSYGKGTDVTTIVQWDTIVSRCCAPVRSDTLAIWDAIGLRGTYQLKLFARDTLGHESEDIITVHVVDATKEIKSRRGGYVGDAANNIQVYFPPNSLSDNTEIQIRLVTNLNAAKINTEQHQYAGLAYDIMPTDIEPKKPGTLTFTYVDSHLVNVEDEKRLGIFRYNETKDKWNLRGGTVSVENNTISTTITELGRYGLFENLMIGVESSLSAINCEPRMFSPQGGGYDTKTTISFELGKDSDVTIKIYNGAGRLVRLLKESETMPIGNNVVYWDGKDEQGRFCVSGLYIVTVQSKKKIATKTIVVLNK